jgi:hypothetical protein
MTNVIQFPIEHCRERVIAQHLEAAANALAGARRSTERMRELAGMPPRNSEANHFEEIKSGLERVDRALASQHR